VITKLFKLKDNSITFDT